eukprot:COSAG01_NODE_26669_length_706_cov_2.532125_1_plen_180_part_10
MQLLPPPLPPPLLLALLLCCSAGVRSDGGVGGEQEQQEQQRYCTSRWSQELQHTTFFASVNEESQQERRMRMENTAAEPLEVYWVNPDGEEITMTKLAAGRKFTVMTASGHAFRAYFIRPDGSQKLAYEHRVTLTDQLDEFGEPKHEDYVRVMPCGRGAKPFVKGGSSSSSSADKSSAES